MMNIIERYKSSFESYHGKPAPKIWQSGKGGFTLVHDDGHRERLTTRDMRLLAGLNEEMKQAVEEINHG